MIEIISHRGNINGPYENENSPEQIEKALKLFKVEVDVWYINNKWFLGHDKPIYEVGFDFFDKNMFLHCKNFEAVKNLYGTCYNWFWHEDDQMTLTSQGDIWCYPGKYIKNGLTVFKGEPTLAWAQQLPIDIKGICTDYPLKVKEMEDGF